MIVTWQFDGKNLLGFRTRDRLLSFANCPEIEPGSAKVIRPFPGSGSIEARCYELTTERIQDVPVYQEVE